MNTGAELITTIEKEMGITQADFFNGLPSLLDEISYQRSKNRITFKLNGKNVEITLGPEGVRELGQSVRLPVTPVTLRFFNFPENEINDFIRRFNLKFMKGGG